MTIPVVKTRTFLYISRNNWFSIILYGSLIVLIQIFSSNTSIDCGNPEIYWLYGESLLVPKESPGGSNYCGCEFKVSHYATTSICKQGFTSHKHLDGPGLKLSGYLTTDFVQPDTANVPDQINLLTTRHLIGHITGEELTGWYRNTHPLLLYPPVSSLTPIKLSFLDTTVAKNIESGVFSKSIIMVKSHTIQDNFLEGILSQNVGRPMCLSEWTAFLGGFHYEALVSDLFEDSSYNKANLAVVTSLPGSDLESLQELNTTAYAFNFITPFIAVLSSIPLAYFKFF